MRLFFAYWPTPAVAEGLGPWLRNAHALFGGRMMRSDTLHLTLAFLGSTEPERLQALVEDCVGWRLPSGTLRLSEPGRFPRAKVVWVGPDSSDPASLAWLYDANALLWQYLAPHGWQRREPVFRPHVSLLRNAGPGEIADLQGPVVDWAPERCVLVASRPSETGSHYTVLAEIPLRAGG